MKIRAILVVEYNDNNMETPQKTESLLRQSLKETIEREILDEHDSYTLETENVTDGIFELQNEGREVMKLTEKVKGCIEQVVNYIYEQEKADFEQWVEEDENANPDCHIFTVAKTVRDFLEQPEDEDTIQVSWSIDDVLEQAVQDEIGITEDEAREILAITKRRHDASIGINWDVLSAHIRDFARERAKRS